ncbi:DUF6580 family putative transport protein [Proteiniphilum sp. X52]|uniref:DUF6580 family putative transport protein n=1 Tax=Proteiniphilum sp. X52 TaxID=2382159 RepID=UPI000F09A91A|nr:DUF6580 family putative transport protein [Proteiniphilum sp. X52]RNC64499.1 hypothetical protein D7D25_11380 [Proteiniphilum sp. X52]
MNKKLTLRFSVVTVMILLAALSRLLPHPPNFAPIGGMALFGAAYYTRKGWAYLIPIVAMWISDLLLNNVVYAEYFDRFVWFHSGSLFTYGAFALIVLMGTFTLRKVRVPRLLFSALGASVVFFVVSNFGVWLSSGMYPHTREGLTACYVAGLPFFKNTLLGDLVYSAALFGLFEVSLSWFPGLRTRHETYAEARKIVSKSK